MVNKKNTKKELHSFIDTCIRKRLMLKNYPVY